MNNRNILYVCQEITPYMPPTPMSVQCRALAQGMQEKGNEIRTFMPRYGCINERRNQLHEVIRLSGMNLIINDTDHQLIIKVASIPSARVQVYFIDNDDYFSRKAMFSSPDGKFFDDNDERAIFFARGVLETVKKLRWEPTIVHCHGWFSSMIPIYLKQVFSDDPLFRNAKIAVSLHDDAFPGMLSVNTASKLVHEGVDADTLKIIGEPSYENLMKLVINHADGIVIETETPSPALTAYLKECGKPLLEYRQKETKDYLDNYQKFYEEIL